jgi:hypothetical protein
MRHPGPGRVELLRAAVTAAWRPDGEAAEARQRVTDSVLRAAAGGLAVATLGTGGEPIPVGTALAALDGLRAGERTGPVPAERLLAQLADRAGLLYAPAPGTVAFPQEAVRQFLAAEHLAAHPGPATDRIVAAHTERTGSSELAGLVAELSAARRSVPDVPGLLAYGVTGRRLTAARLPAEPAGQPHMVRSSDDLRRLTAWEDVTDVWCQGPVDGLEAGLPAIPALRSLVITDHCGLSAVPDMSGCPALRSLRLLDCPRLRDVEAVTRSGVMFLTIDPWGEYADLSSLGRARWLRRLDLGVAGARPAALTVAAGRVEVHQYPAGGRREDPPSW